MSLASVAIRAMLLGAMSCLVSLADEVVFAETPSTTGASTPRVLLDPIWSDQPAGKITSRSISNSWAWKQRRFETLLNVKLPNSVPIRWTNLHDGRFSLDLFVTTEKQTWRRTIVINSVDESMTIDNVPQGRCLAILRSLDPRQPLYVAINRDFPDELEKGLRFDGSQTGCLAVRVLDHQNQPVDAGEIRISHHVNFANDHGITLRSWRIEKFAAGPNAEESRAHGIQRLKDGTFVITGLGFGTYRATFRGDGKWQRGGGEVKPNGGVYVELHQRERWVPLPNDLTERAADLQLQLERLQSPHAPVRAWGAVRLGYYGTGAVPAVPQLVEALDDDRPVQTSVDREHGVGSTVNGFAETALRAIGNGAISDLIDGLSHASPRVRWAAADILGDPRFHDVAAIEPLARLFEDPACPNRWMAARSLGYFRGPATPRLVELARTGNVLQRRWAICALGIHRDPSTDNIVLAALGDPASEVRIEAAERLADFGEARLTRPLIERLRNTDSDIRPLLIRALEYIREGAIDELLAAIESETTDVRIRRGCLQVMSHHFQFSHKDDARALPLLHYVSDEDPEVRQWATASLQYSMKLIGPRVTSVLLSSALQDSDPRVQAEAAAVCSKFAEMWESDKHCVPLLSRVLTETHRKWRDASRDANSRSPEIVADQQALQRVMTEATTALGKFRDQRAAEPLVQVFTENNDPVLKAAIVTALCEIADLKGAAVLRGEIATRNVAAIAALGTMRDRESLDELVDLLQVTWEDKVCVAIVNALENLDDERAAEPLMHALKQSTHVLRQRTRFSFRTSDDGFDAVVHALGRVGDAAAAKLMVQTSHRISPPLPRIEWQRVFPDPPPVAADLTSLFGGHLNSLLAWHPYPLSLASIGPVAIPSLVEGLSSKDALTRAVCAKAIALLPDGPYPSPYEGVYAEMWTNAEVFPEEFQHATASLTTALLKAILDDEPFVRLHAIRAVGRYGMTAAVPRLIEARTAPCKETGLRGEGPDIAIDIESQRNEIREAIAKALGEIGGVEAEATLRSMFENDPQPVRLAAVHALGSAKSKESVAQVIELLTSLDTELAVAAAFSLSQTEDRSVIPPLIACLSDRHPESLRGAAARMLGGLRADEARSELARLLKPFDSARLLPLDRNANPDRDVESRHWMLQQTAIALVLLKDEAGEAWFQRAITSDDLRIRNAAIFDVAWIEPDHPVSHWTENASILAVLRRVAADDDAYLRQTAITALRQPADDDSRATLVACLKDNCAECRSAALMSLAESQPSQHLPTLLQMQDDPSPQVRIVVAKLLSHIKEPRADQTLLKFLDDAIPTVNETALKSLTGHDSPDVVARLQQLEHSTHSPRRRAVFKHLPRNLHP